MGADERWGVASVSGEMARVLTEDLQAGGMAMHQAVELARRMSEVRGRGATVAPDGTVPCLPLAFCCA
jgi:hypothetical protein